MLIAVAPYAIARLDHPPARGRHPHRARGDLHLRVHRDVLRVRVQRDRQPRERAVLRAADERDHRRLPVLQLRDADDGRVRRPDRRRWASGAHRRCSTRSSARSTSSPCSRCSSRSSAAADDPPDDSDADSRESPISRRRRATMRRWPTRPRAQPIRRRTGQLRRADAPRGDSYGLLLALILVTYVVMAVVDHKARCGPGSSCRRCSAAVLLLALHTSHVRERAFRVCAVLVGVAALSTLLQAVFDRRTATTAPPSSCSCS